VKTFLFGVGPTDMRLFAASLATVAAAGIVASAVPARRAASVGGQHRPEYATWRSERGRRTVYHVNLLSRADEIRHFH